MDEQKNEGKNKTTLYCSFCGKSQHEVKKLIAGPTVFICDECVELCMDIIKEEHQSSITKNKRFCLPNSRIMTHQPSGGFQGQAADIEIHAKEIMDLRSRLNQIYVKHSGKKLADIESLMDRDTFISPEDAVKLGLIDKVVNKRDELNK